MTGMKLPEQPPVSTVYLIKNRLILTTLSKRPLPVERFYDVLDEHTAQQLTPEQQQEIEKAIIFITQAARHKVDIRKSFSLFGKPIYVVFLLGRDLRKRQRQESTLSTLMLALLLLFTVMFVICCILLTLYMIKSALGIDVFRDFHVGIWDWWLSLKDH